MGSGYGRGRVKRHGTADAWYGDWKDAQGRRKRIILGATKAEAEYALAKRIRDRDLELSGMLSERGPEMPVAELIESYLAELAMRAAPRSIKNAEIHFRRLQEDLRLKVVRDISRPALLRWRQQKSKEGLSNSTINAGIDYLQAALRHAIQHGILAVNPIQGLAKLSTAAPHRRRIARALTEWEAHKLVQAAGERDRERGGYPFDPMLRAQIVGGARYGELTRATWGDLDPERGSLRLRAETTKSRKQRLVALDAATFEAILALPAAYRAIHGVGPRPSTPIFLQRSGEPWPANTKRYLYELHGLLEIAGIEKIDATGRRVHCHALRRTAATRLYRAGANPLAIQRILGHADARTTTGYIDDEFTVLKTAVACLPALPGGGNLPSVPAEGESRPPAPALSVRTGDG